MCIQSFSEAREPTAVPVIQHSSTGQQFKAQRGPALHIFIASSGDAGLDAAVATRTLGVECTVYVPAVVAKDTQDMLRKQGANTVSVGQTYSDALQAMYQATEQHPDALVVHSLVTPRK